MHMKCKGDFVFKSPGKTIKLTDLFLNIKDEFQWHKIRIMNLLHALFSGFRKSNPWRHTSPNHTSFQPYQVWCGGTAVQAEVFQLCVCGGICSGQPSVLTCFWNTHKWKGETSKADFQWCAEYRSNQQLPAQPYLCQSEPLSWISHPCFHLRSILSKMIRETFVF